MPRHESMGRSERRDVRLAWLGASLLLSTATAAVGGAAAAPASAQPDVRNIRPHMLLLVDTSGSMERMPSCVCATAACNECLPVCNAPRFDRNRWAIVLEALTGSWSSFSCTRMDRFAAAFSGAYDFRYYLPHFRHPGATGQASDGILDVYVDRVRFGLMTFDGIGTLRTADALVPAASWTPAFRAASDGVEGMYSYGGPRPFSLPGCPTPYMLDNGARGPWTGAGVPPPEALGNLVSVGRDTTDHRVINQEIQQALLGLRPYGATPIAGMLDDLRFYLNNHPDVVPGASGDPYAECRDRYALLLTDGLPNADMREAPYNCGSPGASCPYARAEDIAADLCRFDPGTGRCRGLLDGLFVVGFNIDDAFARSTLNGLAAAGGTGSAYFATDRGTLMTALSAAIDRAAPGTTTRTVPAFASTASTSGPQAQYQFTTGFRLPAEDGRPWQGILERRRFLCSGTTVEAQPISDAAGDQFHETLNRRSTPRKLFTVLPQPNQVRGWLTGTGASEIPGSLVPPTSSPAPVRTGLLVEPFSLSNPNLTPAHLGVSTVARRDEIIRWVHGDSGSARAGRRMGDIYHSSPVVVGPPRTDIADESFNLFRELPAVRDRPTVVYVGTNDGVLHAFVAEDHTVPSGPFAGTYRAGEELWGFIPPMLLPKLEAAMTSHQWMVDGTPVVREVFHVRLPADTPTAEHYRTVLVVGLRDGGNAYVALDVTNPLAGPKFLWQFTHPNLGETTGVAGLGQILTTIRGQLHERGVAILPGGRGLVDAGHPSAGIGCPARGTATPPDIGGTRTPRQRVRCWRPIGRQLFVVDLATGLLLRHFDETVLPAPLVGGVSLFTGETGTIASRAYVTDVEGNIWRLDLSDPVDPARWSMSRFYDIFYDVGFAGGQPGYHPPILSTRNDGRVVVIQATGDIDLLDGLASNRVVSLTEDVLFDASGGVSRIDHVVNWEIRLGAGEQVTGPLELFDGKVYFGTFSSQSNPNNLCNFGFSRIWGVDYLRAETPAGLPLPGLESTPGSGTFDLRYVGPLHNQIVMGVAVAQRPTCITGLTDTSDPYFGPRFRVTGQGGGTFHLVAQLSGTGASAAPGGSVGEFNRELPRPVAFSRTLSFTSTTE
ncbi:MAG: PilC/PilY family type IV pilus protein [Myxococcota bacterium]|nr:PilC/PilY family type IV pilus protein [Myxococcota bacterium]MDW8362387.1 PilC/PilY family type IV pilus protein [Myxococcales bacterium]